MEYEKRKHNTPISTVIKSFLDKKGGKVKVSRYEIDRRFNALDWRYQKQILFAFLESGKSDRDWAYRKLFAFWDDCFIPVLQGLWEKYHEETLTWLIIRYFPIDFIKKNYDKLNERRNYYDICARMSDIEGFVVDKTRLSEYDLLRIKRILGEPITLRDAKDLFFMLCYKFCKGAYKFRAWRTVENYKNAELSLLAILNRPIINKMLLEIENLRPKGIWLSMELRHWRETVTKDFIAKYGVSDDTYWGDEAEELLRNTQKEHCYGYIDKEYTIIWDTFDINNQQQFLDYLEKRHHEHIIQEETGKKTTAETLEYLDDNPSVRELFEYFDLEVVNNPPF